MSLLLAADFTRSLPAALCARARIVLCSVGGEPDTTIADRLTLSKATVGQWRRRFIERRMPGLYDEVRPGRPRTIDDERVALLLICVDENSPCQALERTQPMLPVLAMQPMGFGYAEGATHDVKRHGTTTLFATLMVINGAVLASGKPRRRRQQYLPFLPDIDKAMPAGLGTHCFADNCATHKHAKLKAWLATRPRWHMHFTATYSAWLNQVERFFSLITDKAIRRGSPTGVKQGVQRIEPFVTAHNTNCRPFKWTATAASILETLHSLCTRISGTGHQLDTFRKQVNALLRPTLPTVAPVLSASGDTYDRGRQFMLLFSWVGVPSVSAPCGFDAGGTPIGMQITGDEMRESLLQRIAAAHEAATAFHSRRPPVYTTAML